MSTRLRDAFFRELDELRYEPTEKRIRAVLGEETVVDSVRALLVWEPRRVVPTYAVPEADVRADLSPAPPAAGGEHPDGVPLMGSTAVEMVLDPSIPFAVRSTPGQPLVLTARGTGRTAEAFRARRGARRPRGARLRRVRRLVRGGRAQFGHPRDPFHRVDVVHSSRHVRVELDGQVLPESTRPRLLFEPPLPVRYYLPPEDVRTDLLEPTDTRTFCAYKGQAHYASVAGEQDVAWTYPEPLREAAEVTGCYAFFNERVDLVVDGQRLERPVTPWSPRSG